MYLAQPNILNFEKIQDVEAIFKADLNVMVGANNVGKTADLQPLRDTFQGLKPSRTS